MSLSAQYGVKQSQGALGAGGAEPCCHCPLHTPEPWQTPGQLSLPATTHTTGLVSSLCRTDSKKVTFHVSKVHNKTIKGCMALQCIVT